MDSLSRRGRLRSCGWLGEGSSIPELDDMEQESDPTLPSTEDVIRKTEQITKNIQELLRAAQENKHDRSESGNNVPHFKLAQDNLYFHFLASHLVPYLLPHLYFFIVLLSSFISYHFPFLLLSLYITLLPSFHFHSSASGFYYFAVVVPCPSPWYAEDASARVCAGSGTVWGVSVPWCPGLRSPPLPSSRSASAPLTLPPGTLASVPASQAQFCFLSPIGFLSCLSIVSPHLLTDCLFFCIAQPNAYMENIVKIQKCLKSIQFHGYFP